MARQHISEGLKRFIREHIQTVFRLEVLLLLHRNQSRSFKSAEVANELGFEKDLAQEQLTALAATGLVVQSNVKESKYRYHPADEALGSVVDQLAASYSKQRVPILSLILAERSDSTRAFVEAFRLIRSND
jgi:predicted ArsR family transcriptional regulator